MAWNTNLRWRLPLTCLLLQVAMVVLFGVFVRYDPDADAHWIEDKGARNLSNDLDNEFYYRYPSKSPCRPTYSTSSPGLEPVLTWLRALWQGTREVRRRCRRTQALSSLWASHWRNGQMCANSFSQSESPW